MGFQLEIDNGSAPKWPHVFCVGDVDGRGRGWAWCDDLRRRACFGGGIQISVGADVVSAAINAQSAGVDRVLAVAEIEREVSCRIGTRIIRAGLFCLFRSPCPVCDANHFKSARYMLQAADAVHPGAVSALRAALVPEKLMREPHVCGTGIPSDDNARAELLKKRPELVRKVNRFLRTRNNLPVWPDDPARTRMAQVAFAAQYALRAGLPLTTP